MHRINVFKICDETLTTPRYELWQDGKFYTGNISRELKDVYIARFLKEGYNIFNGVTVFGNERSL